MQTTLAATALLMGLVGGPHCIAMCGAACAGIGRSKSGSNTKSMWAFQVGRLLGYSFLGGLAAASLQGLGWLSIHSAALRPIWTLFHVAAAMLGLMLLWRARQPVWLESSARKVWGKVRLLTSGVSTGSGGGAGGGVNTWRRESAPLLIGLLWSLLPCGLLYSALLVAAMSSSAPEGALVMALFALGSSLSLMAGPWLWLRLRGQGSGQWAVRLAGLALFATSLLALWMGLVHNTAPWCLTP
jgi:sulfite exporter TauE/SafE